jgi:SAM-dependent methyltransferase
MPAISLFSYARMQAELYDERYYATSCGPLRYERSEYWLNFFGEVADHLIRALKPKRVFDAGCALGFLVEAFWDRGVYSEGIDISEYAIGNVRADMRGYCRVQSLTEPANDQFDLVTCIEVLEHIDPEDAPIAITNLCRTADTILFSSSPSDFSEPTHVNVQPPKFWLDLFAQHGFGPDLSFDAGFLTSHAFVVRRGFSTEEAILQLFAQHLRLRTLLHAKIVEARKPEQQVLIQVFPFGQTGHSAQNQVTKHIPPNTWQTVALSLPATAAIPLRVDPAHRPSVIQIKSLAVFDELRGAVLWSPRTSNEFDGLEILGTAIRLESGEPGIALLSYGSDPQIVFPEFPVNDVESLIVELTLCVDTHTSNFENHLESFLRNQQAVTRELRNQKELAISDYQGRLQRLGIDAESRISTLKLETAQRVRTLNDERDTQVRQLDLELQARLRQVHDLEQQVTQLLRDRDGLSSANENAIRELKIKQQVLAQTRDELRCLSDNGAKHRHEVDVSRQQVAALEGEIGELNAQIAQMQRTLHNVLTSASWKITKPARDFMAALRGGPRQPR